MSRAARRQTARAEQKAAKRGELFQEKPKAQADIHLRNPVSEHFETFIFGNATVCQRIGNRHRPGEKCDTPECSLVVEQGSGKGQHLVLCGAGPSLAEHAHEWCPEASQVWGCNSAATWLYDNGHRVTHAFSVDQTPAMLNEWASAPDVEYLLASSCHPHLVEFLLEKGRTVRWFHNYVGVNQGRKVEYDGESLDYEDWLYAALYPSTVRAGAGLNAVNRALDVALFMDFESITVLGADCALRLKAPKPDAPLGSPENLRWLREDVVMHADGGSALASGATPMTLGGTVDGRYWESKPDMMISAVWLVKAAQREPRIRLIGDTLPNALAGKDDTYLRRLPTLVDGNGVPLEFG